MSANRDKLDALAQALLEKETLEQDEAYQLAGIEAPSEPAAHRSPDEAEEATQQVG